MCLLCSVHHKNSLTMHSILNNLLCSLFFSAQKQVCFGPSAEPQLTMRRWGTTNEATDGTGTVCALMGIVRIAAPMSNPTEMPFVVKALIQKKSSFFFFTGVDYTVLLVEEW